MFGQDPIYFWLYDLPYRYPPFCCNRPNPATCRIVLAGYGQSTKNYSNTIIRMVYNGLFVGRLAAHEGSSCYFYSFACAALSCPGIIWLFSKSLFDDNYQWRRSYGWLFAALVGIHYLVYIQFQQPGLPSRESSQILFEWLIHLASLTFIVLGILEAAHNRESDLVLSRFHFRKVFIIITAGLMTITLLSELSLRGAPPPPMLNVGQKAFIFGLNVFFSLRLLSFKPVFFSEIEKPNPISLATFEVDKGLLAQLSTLMDSQKYWRTEGLTIRRLAEKMQVKEYRLRQAINQHLGHRNFNDYLNSYRVREACAVLSDPDKRDLIVLEIAYDLGYASLAHAILNLKNAGYTLIYDKFAEWGGIWFVVSLALMLLLHDAYFYWTHRIIPRIMTCITNISTTTMAYISPGGINGLAQNIQIIGKHSRK